MTRPGWLVHAEHDARDHAERGGWDEDYLPDRDERGPHVEPAPQHPIEAVEAAIARHRDRLTATTGAHA